MKIFIKQFCGRMITLEVRADMLIGELAIFAFRGRAEDQKKAVFQDYLATIDLMHTIKKLELGKKLSDYLIVDGSTINEIPKSFTMSRHFNWQTLTFSDTTGLTVIPPRLTQNETLAARIQSARREILNMQSGAAAASSSNPEPPALIHQSALIQTTQSTQLQRSICQHQEGWDRVSSTDSFTPVFTPVEQEEVPLLGKKSNPEHPSALINLSVLTQTTKSTQDQKSKVQHEDDWCRVSSTDSFIAVYTPVEQEDEEVLMKKSM